MSKPEIHKSSLIDDLFDSISEKEKERTRQKMLLAAKIEDAMKAKGWKKKDLAEALGIRSPSIVSRWFSGTHNFSIETLIDLQSVLDVNLLNVEKPEPVSVMRFHIFIRNEEDKLQDIDFGDSAGLDFFSSRYSFYSKVAEA